MNNWLKNLRGVVIIALTVIVVTSVVTYFLFNRIIDEARFSNETALVNNSIDHINFQIKTAEISIRDFLLLSDTIFIAEYNYRKKATWKAYDSLEHFVHKHSWASGSLDSVKHFLQLRFSYLDYMRIRFQAGDLDSLDKLRTLRLGIAASNNLQNSLNVIRTRHGRSEAHAFTATENHIQNTRVMVGVLLLMSLLIIIASFYVLIKSQKEISLRERRYRNLFEVSREIIFTMTKNFELMDINAAVNENLGYSSSELKDLGFLSIFNDSGRLLITKTVGELGQLENAEVQVYAKANTLKTFLLSLVLADKNTKQYQGLLFNIHERITLEEERLSLERFANVGKIARLIAHEVRNPITNINLAVEAISSSPHSNEIADYLRIVHNNSNRINTLISELLSSTKLSEFKFEHVSLNVLIDETLESSADRVKLNHVQVVRDYDPEVCYITGDADKLKIAFLNIIVNAIEAMPEHGI